MSSAYIIICRTCGSYRTERVSCFKLTVRPTWRYHCTSCGDSFDVTDHAEYVKQHPPDLRRCSSCDKESVQLVERSHRYPHQPEGEIVDLYKCSFCGQKIQMLVQRSPYVLYD
jgi:DNA-directed RNA polymerase subunit RPC12/RpoP